MLPPHLYSDVVGLTDNGLHCCSTEAEWQLRSRQADDAQAGDAHEDFYDAIGPKNLKARAAGAEAGS